MAIRHRVRADGRGNTKVMSLTPKSAIRQFCRECFGFEKGAAEGCTDPLCPLYPFRVPGAHQNVSTIAEIETGTARESTILH